MAGKMLPPSPTSRLSAVETDQSRAPPTAYPSIAEILSPLNDSMTAPALFPPEEALTKAGVLLDQILTVIEQMKFHKMQARRLAELASYLYYAVSASVPEQRPDAINTSVSEGLEKLIRCVQLIYGELFSNWSS